MNKKGSEFWDIIGIMGIILMMCGLILLAIMLFGAFFLNSGQSTDVAYGVEHNPFWYKLYLKDDHKTVYCIDKSNSDLINLAEQASKLKQIVKVTYQEYIFKGSLCNSDDKYSSVVVTNLEVIK